MEITLRRAAAIQDLIRETRASLPLSPVAALSVYGDVARKVDDERAVMFKRIERLNALDRALMEIRKAVGHANAEAGVSDLLADQAQLGRLIEDLTPLADATPFDGVEITRKRAERAAASEGAPSGPFGRSQGPAETIQVSLLTQDDIDAIRVRLLEARRAKTQIKDRLAEINAMTWIGLSSETEETLRAEHLV